MDIKYCTLISESFAVVCGSDSWFAGGILQAETRFVTFRQSVSVNVNYIIVSEHLHTVIMPAGITKRKLVFTFRKSAVCKIDCNYDASEIRNSIGRELT